MTSYLARRIFFAIFVLWGAVSIIFLVLRLVPGDPAIVLLGPDASSEEIARLRESMGLTEPLLVQYVTYLGDVIRLDFGPSFRLTGDAMSLVFERVPMTLRLGAVALILALVIGLPLGVLAALKVNRFTDRMITVASLIAQSAPNFWVGLVFILVFARQFQLLPSAGAGTWQHLILPAVTLALPSLALLIRLTRSGLLEVIHEGYVQNARAKGLRERIVLFRHAVRNALIPLVTVIGLQFGSLVSGTVIVETVFAWPGVGRLLMDSISHRDYGIVQAAILLIATSFVFINLIVDVLYGYLDPRVRLGR